MTRSTTSALGAMRRFVATLAKVQTEAANCIARMECGESDRRPSRQAKPRKPRWSGPVAPEVRAAREQAFIKRFTLSMEQGKDATKKFFAASHNLSVSEVSRWLSDKTRGIAPGSEQDKSIWRALNDDIARLETAQRAKRQGAFQIPNFPHQSSPTMNP